MKRKTVVVIVVLLLIACLGGAAAYMMNATSQETYFSGIQVEGIELGGLTKEEAKEKFEAYWNGILDTEVTLKVSEKKSEKAALKELGLTYSNQEVLEEAYEIARNGNFISNFFKMKNLEKEPVNITLETTVDGDTLTKVLTEKTEEHEQKMKNATIKREDGKFVITDEKDGIEINFEESAKLFTEKVEAGWADRDAFEFEMVTEVAKAEYTAEMMKEIDDKLGTYSTNYGSSAWGRKQNIAKGASYINGTVVYPGETLSVYELVAPFTSDRGYEMAGAYLNGKTIQSMGGGICQVSTTLYNAALRAELEIVERHEHSMTVAYVPLSADAAISGTYKDLKFKNNYDAPIYVEGYGGGSTLTFTIWGKETRDSNRTIEFYSQTLSSTPPKEKKVKDDTLEEGKEKVIQKGHTGYKTKLWKIIKVDGKETDRVLINSSSYAASTKEIAVGTKKKEEKKKEEKKNNNKNTNKNNNKNNNKTDSTTESTTEATTAAPADTTTAPAA